MIAWNKKDELWIHLGDEIEIHPAKLQLKFLHKSVEAREQPQSVNIWISDKKQLKRLRRALKKIHQHLQKQELKAAKKTEAFDWTRGMTPTQIEARMSEIEAEPVLMDHEREEMRALSAKLTEVK